MNKCLYVHNAKLYKVSQDKDNFIKLEYKLKTPFDTALQASKYSTLEPELPSSTIIRKFLLILEDREYMTMMKEKLAEIKSVSHQLTIA